MSADFAGPLADDTTTTGGDAAPAAVPVAPDATTATARRRPPLRRRLHGPRFGIVSKLLLMLLVTSIVSCLVVGVVGYTSGRDALRASAFDRLQEVRESRAREITRAFSRLRDSLVIYTRGSTAIEAVDAFTDGFHELERDAIDPTDESAVADYYRDVFVPSLDASTGTTSDPAGFIPSNPAQMHLQAAYMVPADGDFDTAIEVDDADDGSAWSQAHAEYHDYFRELVTRFDYEDALLIDPDGEVVYSAYKGVDLGTNLRTGPYKESVLASGFEAAVASNAVDFVKVTDFERYQPSYDAPTAWALSPVGVNGVTHGVLALQLPVTTINDVMTGGENWQRDGLGDTGETYLVGRDFLMRSNSRRLIEDPERYEARAVAAGTPPAVAATAVANGSTILVQPVRNTAVERAFRGETGEVTEPGYLGLDALFSYAPIVFDDLNWAIIAEIQTDEAFAPVDDFARRLVLTTAAIIVAVALASLLLAQIFSRPLKKLLTGVRQVAAGDLGTQVATSSTDEFADLAVAFNDMSRSLQLKQDLLDAEQAEHERLLLSMMPATVAQRYRQGEETISQEHRDVAVVFADIVGFDEYASGLDATSSLAQLNDLLREFDDAAGRLGVERVRTLRNGYLASVGLIQPRVDNALRALEFAREMDRIVQRFNATNGTSLSLRVGLDAGNVTSGLVGRSSVVYDMWGDAVTLAYRVQASGYSAGIYVSEPVYDRLRDTVQFDEAPAIESASGPQRVWRVVSS